MPFLITFRQLEIFVSVVRYGSFRRCAEELGVSQVSVSEHIRALEERIGTSLFKRQAGGAPVLTEAGHRAEHRAAELLSDMRDFVSHVSGDGADPHRRRSLTMHAFMLRDVHGPLDVYRSQNPDVNFAIETDDGNFTRLVERIERRELDIGYAYCIGEQDLPGSEYVADEPLAIFTSATHPLAQRPAVEPGDLRDFAIVHLAERMPLRGLIDRSLGEIGAAGSRIELETEEFGLILSAVHRSLGFVCMFRASRGEVGQTIGLVEVPLTRPLPPLQIRSLARRGARRDAILREINGIITQQTRATRTA